MQRLSAGFVVVSLVCVCGLALEARAQNALGDGRGMQKNTNKFDNSLGPVNKGFDVQGARMRDAIVFGRAPGGLTTRVSSLPDSSQFMGVLGSDSLYNFRRDSYFSGLAGQGIRSTDALQYQFAMTTGGTIRKPGLLDGTLEVGRFGGASGASVTENPGMTRALTRDYSSQWKTDTMQTGGALRATSSFVTSSMLKPSLVGQRADGSGTFVTVAASPMLGLQPLDRSVSSPLNMPAQSAMSAGATSAAAPVDPRSAAPGGPNTAVNGATTSMTSSQEAMERLRATGRSWDQSQNPNQPGSGAGDKPGDPKSGNPNEFTDDNGNPTATPKWMQEIDKLRQNLNSPRTQAPGSGTTSATKPMDMESTKLPPGVPKPPPGMRYEGSKLVPIVDESVMGLIRQSSTTGARFIKPIKDDRDPFVTEMVAGERLFGKSQFFLAEEKFARALSLRPGDTSAMTARIHAQLAGGLYQSAAANLRELLTNEPELSTIRYARDLLPNEERTKLLEEDLDSRMGVNPRMLGTGGLKTIRDAGLLRAYLAYQLGEPKAVNRGLELMLTSFEGRDEPTLNEQALAVFLRGVWTGPEAEKKAPVETAPVEPAK